MIGGKKAQSRITYLQTRDIRYLYATINTVCVLRLSNISKLCGKLSLTDKNETYSQNNLCCYGTNYL